MVHKKIKLIGKIMVNDNMEYYNYPIYQSLSLSYHTLKHKREFINDSSYYYTLNHICEVISYPFFVYYDNKKNSLKYFKKLKEYVCVVVKIDMMSAYVSTFYPVSFNSILKIKSKYER